MAEMTLETQSSSTRRPRSAEDEDYIETPDIHGAGVKIQRAKEVYDAYAGFEEKPSMGEVLAWFFYGMCSYFIHTVLVPVLFPLIISQSISKQDAPKGWVMNSRGLVCKLNEMQLYEGLTKASININNLSFSPLQLTSISWVLGLVAAAPILGSVSFHLDHGRNQQLIAAAATATGAIFCLPAGFFKTTWIFLPYLAIIIAASTICSASHTRILGLIIRGFIGSTIKKTQFPDRRSVSGWLSLFTTASGCLGAAIISAFTYHMLSHPEKFLSLWIVSIFSGLIWFAGIVHVGASNRTGSGSISSVTTPNPKISHLLSIFRYPHAAGSLAGVLLSSSTTMCIFTGGVLYLIGEICIKPSNLLYVWLAYFLFPFISLPLIQPLQQLIRADAVKMQILGFLLSAFTSGVGFYYRKETWMIGHVLCLAGLQGLATGLVHSFARVLLLDCSPAGKEGVFAAWFSWVRALGTCVGFAVATAGPGKIGRSSGVAFCGAILGMVVLIFGNLSSFGGAVAAGHVREDSEKGSPVHGLDGGYEGKVSPAMVETPSGQTMEV